MRLSLSNLLSILLAITLSALTVQGQKAKSATAQAPADSSIVVRAQSLLNAGQIDSAIEMLNVAARFKPNDAEVKHLLGLAFYRKNDYQHAIEQLSVNVRQTPQSSRQYREEVQILGLSHYLLGHTREAVPYLEQLNQWSPGSTEIAYALGISYIQTRNTDKSRETFARMFNLPPTAPAAYLVNAQMMVRQQFEEGAEQELQKALRLDPKLPQANFLLGDMAIYHSQIEQGIELLQKDIAIKPAFGMAYYIL